MRIRQYLDRSGMPATRFGRESVGDPRLVHDLRLGRTLGERISDRIERYLAEHGA